MQISIIGAGKLGRSLAQALLASGHEVTLVDSDPDVIQKISSRLDLRAVNANALNLGTLRDIDAGKNDAFVACTDDDSKNMVLCSLAKKLGVRRCIARVADQEFVGEQDLIKAAMHIDMVINPDLECANEIYRGLTSLGIKDGGIDTIDGISCIEFSAERMPKLVGKTLTENAPNLNNVLIGAISRDGSVIIPNGLTSVEEGDILYAFGDRKSIGRINRKLRRDDDSKELEHVMIAGGGKTGYYLAKQLLDDDIDVRIIESDYSRARFLAEELEGAKITFGDAADIDLLHESDIDLVDAFVACTGIDEANIMLSMVVQQKWDKDVIAKISRSLPNPIEGISSFNTVDLCTSRVMRYINEDKFIVFSKIIKGQAEFSEVDVTTEMPMCGKTLAQLNVGEGILIAAIFHEGKVVIPNGQTEIKEEDKVLILSLVSKASDRERLFKKTVSGDF